MLAIGKDCAEIRKVMANYEFNHMVTVDPITPPFPHNVTLTTRSRKATVAKQYNEVRELEYVFPKTM
ncbi:hypothetical protein L917_15318 [Phytophthora nicotianae]|uniref:Uncharacterized protein n=3 Tax=Phytophthora nicotianae TaxID=4792 RepID=W2PUC0_PHYN3|nr:hypothetical protein PPTG_23762 [Phytophthora nicotianae INRA-310]ETK78344.1 hypothetical protein L915_15604 [Phytophthora nicotianae]ETL31776.1 hypothetical protein L916_15499 [Phytophthora nicotianae]ETL85011.1 hypothetical protein L917_15318 [Phytophthora nicotianae]ETN03635.1 hypothetical protein PPTG_23762 [Phytophthora nicotianae INRA-310]